MREDIKNIRQRFRSSIRLGTGEAYLIMQQHPGIDFSYEIIKACIKNFSYDGQCEGSRVDYLNGLIILSVKQDKIKTVILEALVRQQKDTWTLTQLFELAKIFAQHGNKEAKKAIYYSFSNNPIKHSDWAGEEEILELDAIEGLKYIAQIHGQRLEKSPDDWHDGRIIKNFQEENPQLDVWNELEQAAKVNRWIEIYLNNVKQTKESQKNYKPKQGVYKDAIEEVLKDPRKHRLSTKKWSETDLDLIGRRLLFEKNRINRDKLLLVFKANKFPFDSEFILNLAKQKTRSSANTAKLAVDALRFLKSDNIRQFAIEKINTDKYPAAFVGILIANYKNGDSDLLTKLAASANNELVLEYLAYEYPRIYRANRTAECQQPLETIYNKHTCGICRKDIVEVLIENEALSDNLRKEIQYDCNEETRGLIMISVNS